MISPDFIGGVHPKENKLASNSQIENLPLPEKLYLSLKQHIGPEMKPIVNVGDNVEKYQKIAETEGRLYSCLHSPCNGVVKDITDHDYMASGKVKTIVIENSPHTKEDSIQKPKTKDQIYSLSKDKILEKIKQAGIVGLGGAMFPTHFKLSLPPDAKVDTLVINAAECEPYITIDHRLMLEKSLEILKGIELIQKVIPVKAIIAIEDNKKDAATEMQKAIKENSIKKISVVTLKTKYPQGGEKNIIKSLLNREVPPGKLPLEVGCVVQNVGTCKAIYDAVYLDKPLIERGVTVTGDYNTHRNLIVSVGTTIQDVLDHIGFNDDVQRIIIGGPMMGFPQSSTNAPLIKGNNCIILKQTAFELDEKPCINCAKCVDACPMFLMPNVIVKASKLLKHDLAEQFGLLNCYECGCCAYVCPSNIPHIKWFRLSKKILSVRKKQ